jgi:hypothetical protein
MPGTKGHSGGKRQGAGKKPTYRNIELTKTAAADLAWFIEDLALDRQEAHLIVSTILSAALAHDRDTWTNLFGNRLIEIESEKDHDAANAARAAGIGIG